MANSNKSGGAGKLRLVRVIKLEVFIRSSIPMKHNRCYTSQQKFHSFWIGSRLRENAG
jgi:hypothetical protein